jgi:serine/threonine-protein phosphatase 2A activator
MENYLAGSYGDNMRIDYGTGHELNFMLVLYCLDKLGVFK